MPLDNYFKPAPRPIWDNGTKPAPDAPVQPGVTSPRPLYPEPPVAGPTQPRPLYPEPTGPAGPRPLYPETPSVQPKPPYPEDPRVPPRPLYPDDGMKPPVATPPGTQGGLSGFTPGSGTGPNGTAGNPLAPNQSFSPYNVVTDNINNLLGSNSRYIQNARQRGLEQANSRGMLNSSMSAGNAERAAIEAAQPILNNIMGLTSQRESQANQSLENQRNRQFQSEFALLDANIQDWVNNQDFNRQFNGQLAMLPIASAADMWSGLMQLAASDPTVFTPNVLAGYQDFFQNGFNQYISRYLKPQGGGG